VLLDGRDASRWSIAARKVGFVFQHYALFRHMTVFENVAFGLRVKPRRERPTSAAIAKKVGDLLDLMQVAGAADRSPSQLSGGQRQRVALARALAVDPELLLLDEPFGALDAQVRQELRRWLRRLHDELHVTSIFVTHDQQEAIEVADRIVVLRGGRVEQVGAPSEVYDTPASEFVHRFLGQVNEVAVTRRDGRAYLGPIDITAALAAGPADPVHAVALIRPHEIEVVRSPEGWPATVLAVRTIGPVVRLDLAADGRPAHAPLEAEMSRERFAAAALGVGERVHLQLRHWRVYAAPA
jgi:sulfate transport system ATP-binding protein